MSEEKQIELTELEQGIFDKIQQEYFKRGTTMVNENGIRKLIKLGNTEGDGMKRVSVIGGSTHLVPIEDIILNGLKATDIEKYPLERKK